MGGGGGKTGSAGMSRVPSVTLKGTRASPSPNVNKKMVMNESVTVKLLLLHHKYFFVYVISVGVLYKVVPINFTWKANLLAHCLSYSPSFVACQGAPSFPAAGRTLLCNDKSCFDYNVTTLF